MTYKPGEAVAGSGSGVLNEGAPMGHVPECGNCGHPEFDHHSDGGECIHRRGQFGWECHCYRFVRPEDATPEMRADRLFPRHWNVVYSWKTPFVAGGPCMRLGCESLAARRIFVNIWGTVCEYEVCEVCGEQWHGKMADDFPCKAGMKAKAEEKTA